MARCVAFLGPSLPRAEARSIVGDDCELRPPVKRGDLPSLPEDVKILAIIDGVFQGESAVGHREILDQMRKGVTVIGGGSMGALRASELDTMGMVGIGEVYRLYSRREIEGDDEVALIFNPENLEALSEPLVNTRHNLQRARNSNIISKEEADLLLRKMRGIYYPRRTKDRLLEEASKALSEPSLSKFEKFVLEDYVDVKMKDATDVLRYVINLAKNSEETNKKIGINKHP